MIRFFCLCFLSLSIFAESTKPNVVLILTDDQGYGDIAALGSPVVKTPAMDKLHSESVRFTDFHVDPTCAPTRSALLTGRYSHRVKVWHTIASGNHLEKNEVTMANVFKKSGYQTGIFGKWHLGANYPYRPMDRGFDEWLGNGDGGTGTTDDYFYNDRVNDYYLHNGEFEYRKGYASDVFYEGAADFIKNRDKTKPFFTYIPSYIPHSPHTLDDASLVDKYLGKVNKGTAYFYACIERVDQNIAKLRGLLKEEGIAENTIFIFMTDNGGTGGCSVFNAGMRGHKGQVYDGGHRVPFFIHWPAGGLSHGKDVKQLSAHLDVLPSLIELCGLESPKDVNFDGRSFAKQLFKPELELAERSLFVERQRNFVAKKWSGAVAMTQQWRLVENRQLYDIQKDPKQEKNLIKEFPELAKKLAADFDAYWASVSPNNRPRIYPVVGHPNDKETFFSPTDWYLPRVPWNHAHVSKGNKGLSSWSFDVHEDGKYEFELRRWPKETEAAFRAIPELRTGSDAYAAGGVKTHLIYARVDENVFKALDIQSIKVSIAEFKQDFKVEQATKSIRFTQKLTKGKQELMTEMFNGKKKSMGSVYYCYIRKIK